MSGVAEPHGLSFQEGPPVVRTLGEEVLQSSVELEYLRTE